MRTLVITQTQQEVSGLKDLLEQETHGNLDLAMAMGVQEGLKRLESDSFQMVFYNKTVGHPLEQLHDLVDAARGAPVLVLISEQEYDQAPEAVEERIVRHLRREHLLRDLLHSLVDVSYHQVRLSEELDKVRSQSRQERELRQFYERISGLTKTTVTEELYGVESLREVSEDTFNQYVHRFIDLLELALERQIFKVDYNLSEALKTMAEELGFMRASPRDIVEIYTTALNSKKNKVNENKYQAYTEEGRLLLLEMMGYMVTYYRRNSFGTGARQR